MAGAAVRSTILFGDAEVDFSQAGVSASVGRFPTPRLGWTATATAIVAGEVEDRAVHGGAGVSASLAWLPVYERARRPFVGLSATLGAAWLSATGDDGARHPWRAIDLRLGAMVGKTLGQRWVPYASARAFGGPVFWRRGGDDVIGGDRYHVSVGAGLIVRLPAQLDLALEAMPLGEQTATVGVTLHR